MAWAKARSSNGGIMKRIAVLVFLALFSFLLFTIGISAQAPRPLSADDAKTLPDASIPVVAASPSPSPSPVFKQSSSLESHFIQHVFHDQKEIWTAPFHPGNYEKKTVVPIVFIMTGLFATDRYTSGWVNNNGTLPEVSRVVSHFGQAYATGGVAAAFYLTGRITHNPKARETGLLAAQSLIDTGIVTEVLKLTARRQRPDADEHLGEFIEGGTSFPSGHSSSVWSVATVIAYEYKNNPWIKWGAYAAATAVAMSRYSGRNHFLSDIAAGSAAGFLIGRYVYREYHDPNVDKPKYKKTTTWLHPMFVPNYNSRLHSYGGSLVWQL